MNFQVQVQEKTVFCLNRLFYNPLILLSINLSPIALTAKEASAFLKITTQTLYRLIKEDDLPAFRVASEWRFEQSSLETWVMDKMIIGDQKTSENKANKGNVQPVAPRNLRVVR